MVICRSCGTFNEDNSKSCKNCGNSLNNKTKKNKDFKNKSGNFFTKKKIIISSISFILIIAIVLTVLFCFKKDETISFALYVKDNQIMYSEFGKMEPSEITDDFIKNGTDEDYYGSFASRTTKVSNDGNIVFFTDNVDTDDDGYSLYYRLLTKPKVEAEKIDSDIKDYKINITSERVFYIKGNDGDLYIKTLKDDKKDKIDDSVVSFYLDSTGENVIYCDNDGRIYSWSKENGKDKIDSDSKINYVSEDLSLMYYLKDTKLYKKEKGHEKVKIDSDAIPIGAYNTGELYYIKQETVEKKMSDYVTDDLLTSDSALTKPTQPVTPRWNAGTSKWDEYDVLYDQYAEQYRIYEDKLTRDYIREELNNDTFEKTTYILYYYDGKKGTKVNNSILMDSQISFSLENPSILYQSQVGTDVEKAKVLMTDLFNYYENEYYDVEESLMDLQGETAESSLNLCVAIGENESTVLEGKSLYYNINETGKKIYYIDNFEEEDYSGDLYSASISGKKIDEAKKYAEEVCAYGIQLMNENEIAYYKDFDLKDFSGDLYLNKKRVDYDVKFGTLEYSKETKSLLYFNDFDTEKQNGTLNIFSNGKSSKIADDVHDYLTINQNEIIYISDYSLNHLEGSLYLYNGKKDNVKIDDDINSIIKPLMNNTKVILNQQDNYYGFY